MLLLTGKTSKIFFPNSSINFVMILYQILVFSAAGALSIPQITAGSPYSPAPLKCCAAAHSCRCATLTLLNLQAFSKKKKRSSRALELPSRGMPSKICLVLAHISFIYWISGRVHTASHVVVMADRVLIFLFFENAAAHLATPRGAPFEKHWFSASMQ